MNRTKGNQYFLSSSHPIFAAILVHFLSPMSHSKMCCQSYIGPTSRMGLGPLYYNLNWSIGTRLLILSPNNPRIPCLLEGKKSSYKFEGGLVLKWLKVRIEHLNWLLCTNHEQELLKSITEQAEYTGQAWDWSGWLHPHS